MKFVKCVECGKEFSGSPKSCPYCGLTLRKVGPALGLGILVAPYFFSWVTLRKGYSLRSRVISLGYLLLLIFMVLLAPPEEEADVLDTPRNIGAMMAQARSYGITYSDLSRFPDKYMGEPVIFEGKIVQRVDGRVFRAEVTKDGRYWKDAVFLDVKGDIPEARVLEGDIVYFVGEAQGMQRYEAILGNVVEIPRIHVYSIRIIKNNDS